MDYRKTARLPAIVALLCAALGGGVTSPGCAEFDTTQPTGAELTLGEEVYEVFCERIAAEANPSDVNGIRWKPVCEGRAAPPADAPARLVALDANRARLVDALDRTLPDAIHDERGTFLGAVLPFFDPPEERLPNQTRRLADFLTSLSHDDDAIAALERLGTREGYRPLRLALGVTRPVLSYPEFDQFAAQALDTIIDGAAASQFTDVQRALALEMATMEPSATAPGEETTLSVMRQLMFSLDDLFAVGDPSYVLLRDSRGIAMPTAIAEPFVDLDHDGLADVDDLGRFVDVRGAVLDVPAPFHILDEAPVARDGAGRALRTDGTRYYEYIDASRTMLAGTTSELAPWFSTDSPTLMQMSRGLPLLMGGQVDGTKQYGSHTLSYTTFATDRGSLFDTVYALGELMYRPQTEDALTVTEALMRDHESETAGVLRAARYTANQGDLYPNAQLYQPSNFWDDLIDLLIRMAQKPGMLEAVMRSFSDDRSAQLGTIYGNLMRYKDRISYNPAAPNADPLGFPLDEAVNRSAPDTFDNESLFQRTLALIDGLNGVRVCNRAGARLNLTVPIIGTLTYPPTWLDSDGYAECELIDIPNVAEAYALAILGQYELVLADDLLQWLINTGSSLGLNVDETLEQASGIDGMTRRPTPQALNRLVFWGLDDNAAGRCEPTSCNADSGSGTCNCNSRWVANVFDRVKDRHGNDVIDRYHGTIFAWEMPGFYEGMTPMLEVLHRPGYDYDESGRYMFGELLGTLHEHWATHQNTQTCSDDPASAMHCDVGEPNFSYQSNVRSYEPLVADSFIDGHLLERMHDLNLALEAIEVRPGVDGVAAMAAAGEDMMDPRRNPGLVDRHGHGTTMVNDGSRTVPMTPLYLLLDALNGMDRDLAADTARRADWRTARHAIAEQFLATDTLGEGFRLRNQRARAILLTALPFARDRIDRHRADGDLEEWSTTLHSRMADQMREPLMSGLIRFLDAVNEDPEARDALAALMGYLVTVASDNDAFASTLYGAADALMVLDDDHNIVPLMHALSEAMAPNVRDAIASGGELDIEGSAVRDSLVLVRDIQDVDDARTLRKILQNVSALPETGEPVTPLETIIDVIAEVNRATPNEPGSLRADDYLSVFGQVTDFIRSDEHGLERLTAVVQQRQCFPEQGRECNAAGMEMDSSGLCYEGATCTCTNTDDGMLRWQCSAP